MPENAYRSRTAGQPEPETGPAPVLELHDASLAYGPRTLWSGLHLVLHPGEFVAVLGPNGTGKTSLFKVILGLTPLTHGQITVGGRPARRGSPHVGYIPQHRGVGTATVRARDLVRQGIDGHRWGLPLPRRAVRDRVETLLAEVGATGYGNAPTAVLSGGELQRIRVAQALATDPELLLCDEPLLTLDLGNQRAVVELLDRRRAAGAAVLFITHEINPVMHIADRVLYLVDGKFLLGTVDEVLTSENLTRLYSTPIEVVRSGDRLVVMGASDSHGTFDHHHDRHHGHDPHGDLNGDPHDDLHGDPRGDLHHDPHDHLHRDSSAAVRDRSSPA